MMLIVMQRMLSFLLTESVLFLRMKVLVTAMVINVVYNKCFGLGGGARHLHQLKCYGGETRFDRHLKKLFCPT